MANYKYDVPVTVETAITVLLTNIFIIFLSMCFWALPVLLLWNWLMPSIFGLAKISLVQAWGLSALCSILFKGNTTYEKKNTS